MIQVKPMVAGISPATVFYSEDNKYFNVEIIVDKDFGFQLTDTCIQYTVKGKTKQINLKSARVRQDKNIECTYTLEFKNYWKKVMYLTFKIGLRPVTNLNYIILEKENG